MLDVGDGRVEAVDVADIATVEHHGHVAHERAAGVEDRGPERGVLRDERAKRVGHRGPRLRVHRDG